VFISGGIHKPYTGRKSENEKEVAIHTLDGDCAGGNYRYGTGRDRVAEPRKQDKEQCNHETYKEIPQQQL
jgi:hypothetical protein